MTTLHNHLKNHPGSKTDIARRIIESDLADPVRPCIARAKNLPNIHDVSAVRLILALGDWLGDRTPEELDALAQACWGTDEQEG